MAKNLKMLSKIKIGRRRITFILIFVGFLGLAVWKFGRNENKEVTYQTVRVNRSNITSSVSASGQILSANYLEVTTAATGVVKNVFVKDGDRVYQGQKIAEITLDVSGVAANAKAYASLVSAQNALNSAKNNYRLTQASLEKVYDELKGHDTDENFTQKEIRTRAEVANDNAFDAVKGAEANLAAAAAAYRQTSPVITAPAAGIIDNLVIVPGMVLSPATSAMRVAVVTLGGSPLASFNVSEVDVSRILIGQKVTLTLDSIPDKTFTGKVLAVDKIGTVSSGVTNYPVIVSIEGSVSEILPNMAATAKIVLASKENALIIPTAAIQTFGDRKLVRVWQNGKVETKTVETGLASDSETEIISGLAEGEELIIGNQVKPTSGSPVSPFNTFKFGPGGGAVRMAK